MRNLLILAVTIGALASIAVCAGYGWDQATEWKDRATAAFIYGFVAMVALILHPAAVRVWTQGWRKSAVFLGFAGFLAFTMTAFTSLGGMVTRGDKVTATRQDALDTKDDIKKQIADLMAERKSLQFARTTQAGVDAAKRALDTAGAARKAECGDGSARHRGNYCRQKEDAEADASKAYTKATNNKAGTDRFDRIEADLTALRARLTSGEGGTVGSVNPLRDLLAVIFGAFADILTAWQKAVFAVVYDIVLIALTLGIEVLKHAPQPMQPAKQEEKTRLLDRLIARRPKAPPSPGNVVSIASSRKRTPSVSAKPMIDFLAQCVPETMPDDRAEWGDMFKTYLPWHTRVAPGERPYTAAEFGAVLAAVCKKAEIQIASEGELVFCVGRKLRG